ncbi:MAG: hypothetical protein H8E10_11405 [Desulfobacterales bacterium]|jgi:hypothetical protein|nr:hypothetical protein [Desulfobacterales bacterium]MBL7101182.1 hypothetical protein [Desulfobacteraceae bacterium]MBL7171724.1 hypothetical protein [Desulfobacteraceae bacterium]
MRKSTLYLLSITVTGLILAFLLFIHPILTAETHHTRISEERRLVHALGITDLCLFTEARYTRNPTQADLHSAFQDHPLALEHFPSGSLLSPPHRLKDPGP